MDKLTLSIFKFVSYYFESIEFILEISLSQIIQNKNINLFILLLVSLIPIEIQ